MHHHWAYLGPSEEAPSALGGGMDMSRFKDNVQLLNICQVLCVCVGFFPNRGGKDSCSAPPYITRVNHKNA